MQKRWVAMKESMFAVERRLMVAGGLAERVTDGRVLAAMAEVPRHAFVPEALEQYAYVDGPLSIGAA